MKRLRRSATERALLKCSCSAKLQTRQAEHEALMKTFAAADVVTQLHLDLQQIERIGTQPKNRTFNGVWSEPDEKSGRSQTKRRVA
jgi:hypothetical protein